MEQTRASRGDFETRTVQVDLGGLLRQAVTEHLVPQLNFCLVEEHGDVLITDRATELLPVCRNGRRAAVVQVTTGSSNLMGALDSGVLAFVAPSDPAEDFLAAIIAAAEGRFFCSATLRRSYERWPPQERNPLETNPRWALLTHREREIAQLAAELVPIRDIADRMCVSVNTVKTHLEHAYQKLRVHNRRELLSFLPDPPISRKNP